MSHTEDQYMSHTEDQTTKEKSRSMDTLILSGGSIKGVCQLGGLKYCVDHGIIDLNLINCFIGTSVGSIIACFLSLGISIDHIFDFVINLDMAKISDLDFGKLICDLGLNDGLVIENFIEEVLKKKTQVSRITFKKLYELFNKELIITGCSVKSGLKTFSYVETPDMSVSLAIRISISIPILLTPVCHEGELWIDGGFPDHYPYELVKDPESTIGFIVIEKHSSKEITNIEEYLAALYGIFNNKIYELINNKFINHKNTIIISLEPSISNYLIEADREERKKLFDYGFKITKEHFEKLDL